MSYEQLVSDETSTEVSGEAPMEVPMESPGQAPPEAPGETPGETPPETPGEASAEVTDAVGGSDDQTHAAPVDDGELRAALEAILLVVDEPVSEATLAQVLEQPAERVTELLATLAAEYTASGRGFDLRRAAGGWRLYTRAEQAPYVERFVLDGQQARLTQAALETLAVIAYRQPVTRSRVSAIRGVNCDGVIRTLLTRGLVEEVGTEPETGAYLYRTTSMFLEKLGLDSVDQLPPLAPFLPDDFEALDPDATDVEVVPVATPEPEGVEETAGPASPEETAGPEGLDDEAAGPASPEGTAGTEGLDDEAVAPRSFDEAAEPGGEADHAAG